MKQVMLLTVIISLTSICSGVYAQTETPAGAGDKDLRDTNIKKRSIEMERIERDAKKTGKTAKGSAAAKREEDKLAARYDEIKTDFEQIQMSQDAIIKAYQGAGKINHAQIGKSALEINESAVRLDVNLFSLIAEEGKGKKEKNEEKKREKTEKETKPEKTLRDLIIELDVAVGRFVTSPMFQNLRIVDAAVSAKARLDLEKIIELSAQLDAEAQKISGKEK